MVDRKDLIRKLYYSDNLPILRSMEDESVDLIYLDPPFNSNRAYNIIYPDDLGQVTAFEDTWYWTPECDAHIHDMTHLKTRSILDALANAMGKSQICAYLVNMAVRLIEMRRILKPTGSIYLHCNPTASHYLKIVMDAIFGTNNFRNEIIWHYRRWTGKAKKFQCLHDVVFFYTKTSDYSFNILYTDYTTGSRERKVQGVLNRFKGGETHFVSYKSVDEKGVRENDVWNIPFVAPSAKERLGYPTQKPLALLEKILLASSNEGDLVLDPFCGCGTTVEAAEKLKRHWIGIDITYSSIAAIKERFRRQKYNVWGEIQIFGEPKTEGEVEKNLINSQSASARKEFEKFCVTSIGGLPNDKMGADGGIDGRIPIDKNEIAIVSVKSGRISIEQIRALRGLLNGKNKIGIFITKVKPTKKMKLFANQSGIYEFPDKPEKVVFRTQELIPRIQILTLEQILKGVQPILP